MPPPQEQHYNINKLHKIFAIVTIILLTALFSMFGKDYSKQWKEYQARFRGLEIEKARVKADNEDVALSQNEEYQEVLNQIQASEQVLKTKSNDIAQINKEMKAVQAAINISTQKSQFAKAELDATKYAYEEAKEHKSPQTNSLHAKNVALTITIAELRIKIETDQKIFDAKVNAIKDIEKETRELQKKRAAIAKKLDLLTKKIQRIDPDKMTFANRMADLVRDWPILDLANPNYKIKQIVLKEITDDVNITRVPKVDRCITCHLGIDNPDYKNAAQPYKSHPNLELFLDKNSPHPMEEFACTTCHLGRGRATDFIAAAHTPSSKEQREEWEKKYNWKALHHWEQPMLPKGYTEAGCFKCHSNQTVIKGAEKLNLGLNLIERAGCYGCHTIEKYKDWPKPGPSLNYITSKSSKEWIYHWIENPKSLRHNTWMPAFFNQSNSNDPASVKRNEQEIHAIVQYLWSSSQEFDLKKDIPQGDIVKGEELVSSLGCFGCHQVQKEKSTSKRTRDNIKREHGSNLIGLGSKTSKEWIFNWLKDPSRYHSETRMPDMRLTDQEAADIASYLTQDKDEAVSNKAVPPVDEKITNEIVENFLLQETGIEEAKKKINDMTLDEKLNFAGKKLIRHYGCFACHSIKGFENEKPIGTELTEEGTKDVHRLDFGFVHIDHTKEAWFKQKVLDPRIFDEGKLRAPLEKLKMPNYNFTDEEAQAITTAILAFVKDRPNPSKLAGQNSKAQFINEGQELIRQFNCQGCHEIEGEGGTIQSTVTDWLVKYQSKDPNDAKALTNSFSPPNLIGEGKKVQAQWLFEFLHKPETIRPWLSVRMPTYKLNAAHLNAFIKYFNSVDNEDFPFADVYHPNMTEEEKEAGIKLFSKDYFGCAQCHIVGDKMPSGSADSWAPDFMLAQKRLKPEWIVEWLKDPAKLLPGTKMPTYYDPGTFDSAGPEDLLGGDEMRQIRVLRDFILTLTPESIPVEPEVSKKEATSEPVDEEVATENPSEEKK